MDCNKLFKQALAKINVGEPKVRKPRVITREKVGKAAKLVKNPTAKGSSAIINNEDDL